MKAYITEIFSSFQGEGGSVTGSCQGKRQIFIRFSGCNLASQGKPCIWCDSPEAQKFNTEKCKIETDPGSGDFTMVENPLEIEDIKKHVKNLRSSDLHSISITGGEPTSQPDVLKDLCLALDEDIYLETNGTLPDRIEQIAELVDYACIDLKDKTALPYEGWKENLENEFRSIEILKKAGSRVFGKFVVSEGTEQETLKGIAMEMNMLKVPLAIQPVTMADGSIGLSKGKLLRLFDGAAQYLSAEDITLSLQTHKLIGIL